MALQNLNAVLSNLNANMAKQGCDVVTGILGLRTPPAPSHGFMTFERSLKRGRRVVNLPGNPVRFGYWRESVTGTIPASFGRYAGSTSMGGRGLSARCAGHHEASDHDYPSHDRRDDMQRTDAGLASFTNRGK